MQHQPAHQPSALARVLTVILQTITSIIIASAFYSILFYCNDSSSLHFIHTSIHSSADIKYTLLIEMLILVYTSYAAFIPSLLAAICATCIINNHPRYRITIGAAIVALLCTLLQQFLCRWPLDWIPLLLITLAAALSALYFSRPKPPAQKH
jgi:hypothetical protein